MSGLVLALALVSVMIRISVSVKVNIGLGRLLVTDIRRGKFEKVWTDD